MVSSVSKCLKANSNLEKTRCGCCGEKRSERVRRLEGMCGLDQEDGSGGGGVGTDAPWRWD